MRFSANKSRSLGVTLISDDVLGDKNLSAAALGVLAYMLKSQPSSAALGIEQLQVRFKLSRDSLRRILREPQSSGYVRPGQAFQPPVSPPLDLWVVSADPVAQFLGECTASIAGARVQARDLHRLYGAWAKKNDLPALSAKALGQDLRDRGLSYTKASEIFWTGIALTRSVSEFASTAAVRPLRKRAVAKNAEPSRPSRKREDSPRA